MQQIDNKVPYATMGLHCLREGNTLIHRGYSTIMQIGKAQHEEVLSDFIADLEEEGYRVIRLEGKSPDAIAIKIDYTSDPTSLVIEVSAVEALGKTYRKGRGWHGSWTYTNKKKLYSMFDKVLIRTFKRVKEYKKGGPSYEETEE